MGIGMQLERGFQMIQQRNWKTDPDDEETSEHKMAELYDPHLDEQDELWVQKKIKSSKSDAVLNCAACFTTLCLESQRLVGFIEHSVSKMDTLAGVAIKYGVEVGDIKMINGLTTDLQMFALKSLKIPTPGRHPPSPCFYDSSSDNTSREERSNNHSNMMDSLEHITRVWASPSPSPPPPPLLQKQLVSPAMTTLQCYYGLETAARGRDASAEVLPHHRRSRSLSNGYHHDNVNTIDGGAGDGDDNFTVTSTMTELVRRRQRSDSVETGSSISCRRVGGRIGETVDTFTLGDVLPPRIEPSSAEKGVRKSCSMSSLQRGVGDVSTPTRPAAQRCSFKPPDLLRPVSDAPRLPKPSTIGRRRHKAALD